MQRRAVDPSIQQRLLQNPGLTFQTALTTCLAMETAAKMFRIYHMSHSRATYTGYKQTLKTIRVIIRKLLVIVVGESIVQTYVGSKMQRAIFVAKLATLNQSVDRQTNHKVKCLGEIMIANGVQGTGEI